MKLHIEVRDRTVGNMLSILINGNDVATLSHDQADELANKLLEVTCRLSRSPICETDSRHARCNEVPQPAAIRPGVQRMSSNAFDVQIPATEIQIAEAIHASDPNTADTIRRLAFERDKLKADLGKTTRELGFANVRGDLALAESDPPVCRLQFPDGTVPGNAREAAEGWKRWAVEFKRRADLWERLHDKVRVGNFAIRTTYSMPEPHQLVIVAGGIAVWTGSVWLSKTGDDTNRVIDWPVEWWMPLPCGRIPDANGPATLSQAVTKPLVEDLLEATQ